MKKLLALIAVVAMAPPTYGNLIISEIVDATLPGGLPKFVELTNTGTTTIDLSGFSIGNQNNAGTDLGFNAIVLSGSLAAGDSYVISYENSDTPGVGLFFDTYGFDPDNFDPGSFINGDDRVILFAGAALAGDPVDGTGATIVDIYGVDGVDGTGENWEYTDGFAFRNPDVLVGNGGIFDESEWTFGGANSLETGDDTEELALILAETTPGAHAFDSPTAIPEPSSMIYLSSLALGGLVANRRRRRSQS